MAETRTSSQGLLLAFAGALALTVGVLGLMALIGVGEDQSVGEGQQVGEGQPAEGDSRINAALLADLADGGEVLLFRHAITDTSQTDADATTRGTCDMQRNLSAAGVAQAQRIGAGLRAHGLDGGPVHTSPFCRAIDTALAILDLPTGPGADLGPVQPEESLRNITAAAGDEQIRQAILDESTALIAREVGGPDVVLMIAHTLNVEALTGEQIAEGDAVVLGPGDPFVVRGVIPADAW